MKFSKKDWKLFRERIGDWQERYIKSLNQSYIELLNGPELESEKFWELYKRIKEDKRSPGVCTGGRPDEALMEMINMFAEGIISADDLDGFSPELIEHINRVTEFRNQDYNY